MERYLLVYLFSTFAVGVACLGVAIGLARRKGDRVARAFLAVYAALSLMVTSSLVLAVADAVPGTISPTTRAVFAYLEAFVARYGLMLALPLFAHRIFAFEDRRREGILVAIVVATFGLQHVTEFGFASTVWDDRGDVFEDVVFAGILTYTFWLGFTRFHADGVWRPLALRFLALSLLGLPGMVYDLFLSENSALRLYPLWYCVSSLVITWTLVERRTALDAAVRERPASVPERPDPAWGLSEREAEVAGLVAQGLSNKDIAAALHISQNTVKSHLRAVFDKAGVHSRFELISRIGAVQKRHHPDG